MLNKNLITFVLLFLFTGAFSFNFNTSKPIVIAQIPVNWEEKAKAEVSRITGISPNLLVVGNAAFLANTGIRKFKVIDPQDNIHIVSLDANGNVVSQEVINQILEKLSNQGFVGKLEAALDKLIKSGSDSPIDVVISLKGETVKPFRGLPSEDRITYLNNLRSRYAKVQQPLVEQLIADGQQVTYQSLYTSMITAKVTPSIIKKIANRPDVSLIYLANNSRLRNSTSAQSRSISVEQNIDNTKIVPGAPIKYQHFGEGKRTRRNPAGVREHCLLGGGKNSLTVLVPENNPVLTTVERPKLFFYIPKTAKTTVKGFELILHNADEKVIYQQTYKANQQPGIFSIDLPADKNQRLLEAGQEYNWYLVVICDRTDRSLDQILGGTVKKTVLDNNLSSKLKKASPRERAALYAANGIWYDSLAILADLRRQRPNDAAWQTDWQNLLESVKLANIVSEPLLDQLEIE